MPPKTQGYFRPVEQKPTKKFTPYESDASTSGSDSESEVSSIDDDTLPNFAQFASNLQMAAGPSFPTDKNKLDYHIDENRRETGYSYYKQAFNIELPFDSKDYDLSGTGIWKETDVIQKQPVTSIIMLNSRDRDRTAWPTPSQLTLRLPRIYKNITSLQVVQMKLLSSFLYFRADKQNISILVNETGRSAFDLSGTNLGILNVLSKIREGTYNINSLLTELTTQLNTPPIFYDYPNGFKDFVPLFVSTGDFGINFNYPGEYFYDSINRQYVSGPTRNYIVSRYWQSATLGYTPTLKQTKVAYYYPLLKEFVVDPDYGITLLNIAIKDTTSLLQGETIKIRIVYTFQGVTDPIILQVIELNVNTLDTYRIAHTFRNTLVNKYVVSYDSYNNHINIQSPSLNTSLVNLFTTQYNIFLSQQLTANGLTTSTYAVLQVANTQILSIINAMYDYIQEFLAIEFGVNFNTYDRSYFTNVDNYINIQDALNASGISSNYDQNVIENAASATTTNILEASRKDPTYYWPNMNTIPLDPVLGTKGYPINLGASNVAPYQGGSNYPYTTSYNDFDFTRSFIDSAGNVFIDFRQKAADILCPIDAAKYTVFRFRSLYRQTLQIETLPRPTAYRYPAYNASHYNSNIVKFFDNSYSYVFNANNLKMDNIEYATLRQIPGFTTNDSNFGINYTDATALWTSPSFYTMDVRNNQYNFAFTLPLPSNPNPTGPAYKHKMSLRAINDPSSDFTTFPSLLKLFIYHDRAGFMADLSGNSRNESRYHYKAVVDVSGAYTDLQWNAFAGQTYYAILRSANITVTTLRFKLILWYPNGSNYTTLTDSLVGFNNLIDPSGTDLLNYNFAINADTDYIRLPSTSNLWDRTPDVNPYNQQLSISNVNIGYDKNGVSTDLTDYVGYIPNSFNNNLTNNSFIRVDPITGYFFQAGSPYSTSDQSYFYNGSENFILTPYSQSVYTPAAVSYRQFKIIHWYDTTYLPDPNGFTNAFTSADVSQHINPYTLATTGSNPISNYDYDINTGNIQLGLGPCGFSFVPSDGIWNVDRVMFRSAFTGNDLNSNIAFLGVFLTSFVNTTPQLKLGAKLLTDGVAKLNRVKTVAYKNVTDTNFGFDGVLGTYYEFEDDTTFVQTDITGFSQNARIFFNNANDYYSIIPFDENSNVMFMRGITGSPVPYPYICDASAGRVYFDGNEAPTRKGVVLSKPPSVSNSPYGPPSGISYTLSAYEQSIPIGTQILHYLSQPELITDLSGFVPWQSPGYIPSQIFADVSGVIMIQSTDFKFYSYQYDVPDRKFTYQFSLTIDSIYPSYENTILIGASGNSTVYAFVGFRVVGDAYQVRIKAYNVVQGDLYDLNISSSYQIPDLGFSLTTFSISDTNGFAISGTSGTGQAITYRTPNLATPFIIDSYVGCTSVKTIQPSKSSMIYSLPFITAGVSSNVYFSGDPSLTVLNSNTIVGTDSNTVNGLVPSSYINFLATKLPGGSDQLLFITSRNTSNFLVPTNTSRFYVASAPIVYNGGFSTRLQLSDFLFTDSLGNQLNGLPLNILGGALGSKWMFFNRYPYIWGNRNDTVDAPVKVQNAWQIFYPTTRIVLRKIANAVNTITDLTDLDYPEYPHTSIFVYNTLAAFNKDTATQWGLESSGGKMSVVGNNSYGLNSNGFLVADSKFSGFYFNSYIFNVPLLPNPPQEPYYYLAVRNYSPSEKSQVMLRFNMSQRYDFGFVRLRDLSDEPIMAQSNSDYFNPSYTSALLNFNSKFKLLNVTFGYNATQNFAGSNITSSGFGDFLNQYIGLYNLYYSNVQVLTSITSNVNNSMQNFVTTNFTYILPGYAQTRQNFTDPLTFSILFKSALTPAYANAEDEWGLGWNLGFIKEDTPPATIQRGTSFFKILDDYIYLKLNTEYGMNRLDLGAKEKLSQTTDSQGQISGYNGKLLLNTFGNYAQTIVQNPVFFNPPLLRLDKLSFQWFDYVGNAITNTECEWNTAIQIVEEVPVTNLRGKNPVIIPR